MELLRASTDVPDSKIPAIAECLSALSNERRVALMARGEEVYLTRLAMQKDVPELCRLENEFVEDHRQMLHGEVPEVFEEIGLHPDPLVRTRIVTAIACPNPKVRSAPSKTLRNSIATKKLRQPLVILGGCLSSIELYRDSVFGRRSGTRWHAPMPTRLGELLDMRISSSFWTGGRAFGSLT